MVNAMSKEWNLRKKEHIEAPPSYPVLAQKYKHTISILTYGE